jgi:hypothetical protein
MAFTLVQLARVHDRIHPPALDTGRTRPNELVPAKAQKVDAAKELPPAKSTTKHPEEHR